MVGVRWSQIAHHLPWDKLTGEVITLATPLAAIIRTMVAAAVVLKKRPSPPRTSVAPGETD